VKLPFFPDISHVPGILLLLWVSVLAWFRPGGSGRAIELATEILPHASLVYPPSTGRPNKHVRWQGLRRAFIYQVPCSASTPDVPRHATRSPGCLRFASSGSLRLSCWHSIPLVREAQDDQRSGSGKHSPMILQAAIARTDVKDSPSKWSQELGTEMEDFRAVYLPNSYLFSF
jgi:hypothetical protein